MNLKYKILKKYFRKEAREIYEYGCLTNNLNKLEPERTEGTSILGRDDLFFFYLNNNSRKNTKEKNKEWCELNEKYKRLVQ